MCEKETWKARVRCYTESSVWLLENGTQGSPIDGSSQSMKKGKPEPNMCVDMATIGAFDQHELILPTWVHIILTRSKETSPFGYFFVVVANLS